MCFKTPTALPDWSMARRHLRGADPVLARTIDAVGPCLLRPRRDYFVALCQSIFAQQISTAVATALFTRFARLFPRRRPTPRLLLELEDAQLAGVGASRAKCRYLRDLARHFASGAVRGGRFAAMGDPQIIDALTDIHGVGRWTAEMFLIFALNRPDVLPVDDFGLRKAVQLAYGRRHLPTPKAVEALARPWRPWRTVATWYLWRSTAPAVKCQESMTGGSGGPT